MADCKFLIKTDSYNSVYMNQYKLFGSSIFLRAVHISEKQKEK